jgi:hypothetical protein
MTAGIPISGMTTRTTGVKSAAEAQSFGGWQQVEYGRTEASGRRDRRDEERKRERERERGRAETYCSLQLPVLISHATQSLLFLFPPFFKHVRQPRWCCLVSHRLKI